MNELIEIPNKSSFKINEVCALTGVKSYVLRFWESEFPEIAPLVSSTGIKLYEHRDIEAILLIKKLLFDDKFSIERSKAEMKILMPRENLIESNFNDYNDNSDEGISNHAANNDGLVLSSSNNFQKLLMAKSKLTEVLDLIEVIHQKNEWK